MSMSHFREDLRRYFKADASLAFKLKTILLTQGIWALAVYRPASWLHQHKEKHPAARLLLPFLTLAQKAVEILTGISLPFAARIGQGLYIGHFGGIIISPSTIMGEYCNISQGVTIGQAGRGGVQKTPVIGNRVYIAPGAMLFGGITIGDDVAIGANAVVTKDLPDNAVAVGVPAVIISYASSRDFIKL